MRRVSMALQMQEARARVSGEGGDAEASFQQLSFDFFAESKSETLTTFQRRARGVGEGLDEGRRAAFASASQRVSLRFSFSMEISGAALNGVAGGAEAASGSEQNFDRFLKLVNETLAKADETLNEVFEVMGGLLSGEEDAEAFAARITQIFDGLAELGQSMLSGPIGAAAPAGPAAESGAAPALAARQGTALSASSMSMQMEFEFIYEEQRVQEGDPVVLDLDGDGIELTNYADGARFDLMAEGRQVRTAFVTGGDAFLAMDRNGNGRIDDGTELFGEQRGAANGFEELRALDSNSDGIIDNQDEQFSALRLFRDNGNGRTERGELIGLGQGGVRSIDLNYLQSNREAAGGNRLAQISSFTRTDGSRGEAADAMLKFLG
jgi:hypothetical protein